MSRPHHAEARMRPRAWVALSLAPAAVAFAISIFAIFTTTPSRAQISESPLHSSADKQYWDRKANRIDLIGNAMVRQPGETLTADNITIDLVARTLNAKGNCVYIAQDAVIYGDEMYFNMDTRTGSIVGGRVSNERFTLAGERINKLGEGKFQTHWGEYSTCHDCPQSWTFQAEDVDLEFDGYAYMKNVTTRIKDAPSAWMPYLILPMKSRRQTGFLFPSIGIGTADGFKFVLPFFWAINRSSDMTIAAGTWTERGRRLEWEGRYALGDRSLGNARFFLLEDKRFKPNPDPLAPVRTRWALDIAERQELPFKIDQKLRFTEISDNLYPINVGDVRGSGEAFLSSDLIFSHASQDVFAYVSVKRSRNLLNESPDQYTRWVEPDHRTVQLMPALVATTNDKFLFGSPIAGGVTLGISNFTRSAGVFDKDVFQPGSPADQYVAGRDPLRKGTRATIAPSLYTTFRAGDAISIVPSLQYRNYFYNFPDPASNVTPISSLHRSYLLFQTDLSTQLERIYDLDDPDMPRRKHLIRPLLTYSAIPFVNEDGSHPFIQQIEYARRNNAAGYNFDNYDIVPLDNTETDTAYFPPLGHSVAYGFTTQLVNRNGSLDSSSPSYSKIVELNAGQGFNLRELYLKQENRKPLTRLFTNLELDLNRFRSSTTYYYYPYFEMGRSQATTSASYVFESGTRQGILVFDRSLSTSYSYNLRQKVNSVSTSINFSLNDYFLPTFGITYDVYNQKWQGASGRFLFQSPSRCWQLALNDVYDINTHASTFSFDLKLNLTGEGFGGVTDFAERAAAR